MGLSSEQREAFRIAKGLSHAEMFAIEHVYISKIGVRLGAIALSALIVQLYVELMKEDKKDLIKLSRKFTKMKRKGKAKPKVVVNRR